jgi:hypothetical protein
MPIKKIEFKPGIRRESTQYAESGSWYDCDKVRFRSGRPEKIGGWVKATPNLFAGVARVLVDWVTLAGLKCLFVGTHKKAYIEEDGVFYDITPIQFTETTTNPITTGTAGTYLHTYETTGVHGASAGDYVILSGCGIIDGIPAAEFNKEHVVVSVPTTKKFTFVTATPSTTGSITGGGSVTADFLLSVGLLYNITNTGWGSGFWGRLAWGDPLSTVISSIPLRVWSADNYGEDLVYCPRDGHIYYWDATNGLTTRGVELGSLPGASDVPSQASIVRVTDDRHVVAFGATDQLTSTFDPLLIRWSDQEDPLNWTPVIDNTAGSQRVPLGSYIVAAVVSRQETLIWTDRSLHSMQFTGPPFTFNLQTLAETCDIAGPNAAVNINNVTYWMGQSRFWVYSGRIQTLPCDVQRYVFDDLNIYQLPQVCAYVNEGFAEVTWFYCSAGSFQLDRYVTYNYLDDLWFYGTLSRTAMIQASSRGGDIYAAGGGYISDDGSLFIHEVGVDDGSTNPPSPIEAYIESADVDINDGDSMVFVDRVFPDFTFARSSVDAPELTLSVESRKYSGQPLQTTTNRTVSKPTTATVDEHTKQLWVRLRGRQIRLKISSVGAGVSWLLGALRINIRTDGKQ